MWKGLLVVLLMTFTATARAAAPDPGETVTVHGVLQRVMAIGGETTGYAVETDSGELVEIALNETLAPAFQEGATARVTGVFTTVRGIEIAERRVLVVSDLQLTGTARAAAPDTGETVTVHGVLQRMMAIGGETTGYAVETDSGELVEIALDEALAAAFQEGATARVTGVFTTVRGIEIAERRVLVVSDLQLVESPIERLDQETGELAEQLATLTADRSCQATSDCGFVAYGHQPCGGPGGYLVYSLARADVAAVERVAERHRELSAELDRLSGLVGTCVYEVPPEVACVAGTCQAR
jgi:hypothetical protein